MKNPNPNLLLVVVLACLVGAHSAGALDCNALLSHGLRNIQISQGQAAASKFLYTNHCYKNFEQLDDSVLAEVEAEVFGYGSGSGSFSREQRKNRLVEWCQSHREEARSSTASYTDSRIIYDKALQAWSSCNALDAVGIVNKWQIAANSTLVNVNLRYTGAGASGIQFLGVNQQKNFECRVTGPKLDGEGVIDYSDEFLSDNDVFITSKAIVVNCFRSSETEVREEGGVSYQVLPLAAIGIDTAQESFLVDFPELWPSPGAPVAHFETLKREITEVDSASKNRVNSLETKLRSGETVVGKSLEATNARWLVDARVDCGWYSIKTHDPIVCPATKYVAGVCLTNKGDGCPSGIATGEDTVWHVAGGVYCCTLQ